MPLAYPPPTPEGSWFACRAFDADRNTCRLMETNPEKRPQACYVFPYIYDWQSLHEIPYKNCAIVRRAVRHLGGRIGVNLVEWIWGVGQDQQDGQD
jgi:hypothetical protein